MAISFTSFQQGFPENQCFVIAEAGVNHNGRLELAKQLVEAAAEAKADAVKFQLFKPELLTTACAPTATYQQSSAKSDSQQALLAGLTLSHADMKTLAAYARQLGLMFLCTPFDTDSARFLVDELDVPLLKLSSGDLTTWPFLKSLSELNKPLLLSTGMATLAEVRQTVTYLQPLLKGELKDQLALLHCTSSYPAPDESLNLSALFTIRAEFPDLVVGYSDHSLGPEASVAAVALGARVVEKHITLDTTLPGPDQAASLPTKHLSAFVKSVKRAAVMRGHGRKEPHAVEQNVREVARKSLVTARDLKAGDSVKAEDLVCKRPGTGISPVELDSVLGKQLKCDLPADSLLTFEHLINSEQGKLLKEDPKKHSEPVAPISLTK